MGKINSSLCLNPECGYENRGSDSFCGRCRGRLTLENRYRAIQFIGEGGFGRTFRAIDEQRLNAGCVIKQFLPLPGSRGYGKARELFFEEARRLFELGKHPQIPDLLAFFEQEGRLYLIQELIEGQNLGEVLAAKQRFSEAEVRAILLELLPVVQLLHDQGVIHRDIKPENILCRQDGSLVLIDFGVSKRLGSQLQMGQGTQGTIVGTLGYAAPEQFRGMVHYTSDLYGLGVTGVRLLTGCLPEDEGGTVVDALFDLHSMTWVWREWVAQNGVEVSEEFADILDGMIQEKVRDRISSAKKVLALLGIKQPFFNIHTCLGEWQGTFGLNNASLDVTSLSQSSDNIWKLKGKLMVQGNFLGVLNNKHEIIVEIDLELVNRTVIISEKSIHSGWFWKKAEKNQGNLVLDQHQIEISGIGYDKIYGGYNWHFSKSIIL